MFATIQDDYVAVTFRVRKDALIAAHTKKHYEELITEALKTKLPGTAEELIRSAIQAAELPKILELAIDEGLDKAVEKFYKGEFGGD